MDRRQNLSFWFRPALVVAIGLTFTSPPNSKTSAQSTSLPSPMTGAHRTAVTDPDDHFATADAHGRIATKNLLQVLRDGGPMLIPIGACSFILFIFVFERAISLRRGRVIPGPFVKRFLHQLDEGELKPNEALKLCEANRSPIADVFAAAIKKWGRPSVEVEQAVIDTGERIANSLRRYLRLFNGISTICPLLGLLGTVIGMISAFNAIATADAMGRPEVLAAGISQALLTTAGGLTVAIPSFIAYLYFASRVDRLIMDIDALGQQMANVIASDGWNNRQAKRNPGKSERNKAA